MIEERYLLMAVNIRRTYLKLINNLDLYGSKALNVSKRLEETVGKLDVIQDQIKTRDPKFNSSEKEVFEKILKILDEVEDEGKRLEDLVKPLNSELEKLAKEEQELYRQITEHHKNLSEDEIVNVVKDRLLKEGL